MRSTTLTCRGALGVRGNALFDKIRQNVRKVIAEEIQDQVRADLGSYENLDEIEIEIFLIMADRANFRSVVDTWVAQKFKVTDYKKLTLEQAAMVRDFIIKYRAVMISTSAQSNKAGSVQ